MHNSHKSQKEMPSQAIHASSTSIPEQKSPKKVIQIMRKNNSSSQNNNSAHPTKHQQIPSNVIQETS